MPGEQSIKAYQKRLSNLKLEIAALRRDLLKWQKNDENLWLNGLNAMIRNIQARTDLTTECRKWLQAILDGDKQLIKR